MIMMIFVFGCCMGSWIHACADRYVHPETAHELWSLCPVCHRRLTAFELVPCLSYLALKGKCSTCNSPIPFHSFVCELTCGLLYVLCALCFEAQACAGAMVIVSALLYGTCCDAQIKLIPDRVHVLILFGALLMLERSKLTESLVFSLAVFVLFLLISLVSEALGQGDVKLMAALSLLFSPYSFLVCIALSSCSALCWTFLQLALRKMSLQDEIPFGPFLSFGALVCLFFLS